jgi:nitric-oxide synthase
MNFATQSNCPYSHALGQHIEPVTDTAPADEEKQLKSCTMHQFSCPYWMGDSIDTKPDTAVVPAKVDTLLTEAENYLALFHQEKGMNGSTASHRLNEVQHEITRTGTYWQTTEELTYGAKVAWRNSTRCIGRIYWKSLNVRDMRHLTTAEEIFDALVEHLRMATNRGAIRSLMTVFAPPRPGQPGIRIWNSQLIRYAGYQQPDLSLIGDPMQLEFTGILRQLGWTGGQRTPFDILPIVIQMPDKQPKLFELPPEAVMEVPIEHPKYPWFAELGLKWHAIPVISNMRLEIGGISYTAAPFNGWYMGTEIGARNFGDINRYNMLPLIAENIGLDISRPDTLWQDQAMIDLNIAVLYSFKKYGVQIIDHHTAADYFVLHEEQEAKAGRITPAKWSWIVPPISGSVTSVFHRKYKDVTFNPNFFYQPDPWKHCTR